MLLDPIRSALSDGRLRRRLALANAEAAWMAGHGTPMPPDVGSALVAAFLSTRTPAEAAARLPTEGGALGANTVAFTELSHLVDVDLARTVAGRCARVGYGGPLRGPCVAAVAFPGNVPVTVLAVPHPLLTPKGAFAGVENPHGVAEGVEPAWSPMPWHWIVRLHPERPLPPVDVAALGRSVEEAMETPPDDVSDALLAGVLSALAASVPNPVRR